MWFGNLVEAHCYGIGRTGQIFEQSRSSEETDRNVDVSTAKVFVSTMLWFGVGVNLCMYLYMQRHVHVMVQYVHKMWPMVMIFVCVCVCVHGACNELRI